MNYEFHVGDYVETVSGAKGYINQILYKEPYYFKWIVTDTDGAEFSEFCEARCGDLNKYARIGQYDFTKPKQPKEIGKLTPNGWCMGTSGDDLIRKINELVDAVNKLMKKNISEGEAKFHACKSDKKEETSEDKCEFVKCNNCNLRYNCDEQTEFICKNNDYCYMS